MTHGNRSARAGPTLFALACALPPLLLGWLVWRFGVDLPLIDEWLFLDHMHLAILGDWGWGNIWGPHNGHRLVLARLILVPLGILTGWNVRFEMALIFVLASCYAGVLALVWRRLRPSLDPVGARWLALFGSVSVFSLNQHANWLGGQQVQLLLSVLFVSLGLFVLDRPRPCGRTLAIAFVCGCLANLGQAVGLAFWPAATWMIWRSNFETRQRKRVGWTPLVVWIFAAAGWIALYMGSEVGGRVTARDVTFAERATLIAGWVAQGAAAPLLTMAEPMQVMPDLRAPGALIAAGCIVLILGATLRSRDRPLPPGLRFVAGLGIFSVACIVMTGIARAATGWKHAASSRYIVFSLPLCLVLAVWFALARRNGPAPTSGRAVPVGDRTRRLLLAGFTALAAVDWCVHLSGFSGTRAQLEPRVTALRTDAPRILLDAIAIGLPTERHRRLLREYEFSVFRGNPWISVPDGTEGPIGEFVQGVALSPGQASALDLAAGWPTAVRVRATNASAVRWPSIGGSQGPGLLEVRLASSWLALGGTMIAREGRRTRLPHAVAPGESIDLALCVDPPAPGHYLLRVSMLQEGITWFDDVGSPGLIVPVEVSGPAAVSGLRRSLGRAAFLLGLRPC